MQTICHSVDNSNFYLQICLRGNMALFLFVAVLLSAADKLWADQRICSGLGSYDDNSPFNLLPLPQCPEEQGIIMKVYTRQNPKIGQNITRDIIPSCFNGKVMTIFLVHGWLQNGNYTWMHDMKDTVLAQRDYNVIIVGWKEGAKHVWYPQSASNTRTVGGEIALVSKNLINNGNSSKTRMYCVGHSLGAHVCGHAGQQGQFGRITGLDPAGPLFAGHDCSIGLNPSCADLVDVIHTDGTGLGTFEKLGHIDFYPNGGYLQPGCISESIGRLYDWKHFTVWNSETDTSSLQLIIGCNHVRAYQFFTESVATPCFLSRQKCLTRYLLPWFCKKNNNAVQSMGFNADAYSERGIFYLKTNDQSPFCLG